LQAGRLPYIQERRRLITGGAYVSLPSPRVVALVRALFVLGLVYLFLVGIQLMGSSLKFLGKGFAESMISVTSNPFVGLFIGILATSIVQSSSAVTSMVVVAAQAGTITLEGAVPIVMGANIGTSVTNLLVSFSLVTRTAEFRRGFAGAMVHDLFNLCVVVVLFPLELATGLLHNIAIEATSFFAGAGGLKFTSIVHAAVRPVSETVVKLWENAFGAESKFGGISLLILSLVFLFAALFLLSRLMRSAVLARLEDFLRKYLFRNAVIAFFFGAALTALVQSSSVTTSAVVPLVGAGVLTVRQIFPYTLGANIGTTVTAMLAAFAETARNSALGGVASASPVGVTVALCHFFFNIAGCLIFYPLRIIPISLAERLGEIAAGRRAFGFLYVFVVFFLIPGLMILISKLLE
jgi:solute carrier family 34 (sodium-dependent phosphate cotransporter)